MCTKYIQYKNFNSESFSKHTWTKYWHKFNNYQLLVLYSVKPFFFFFSWHFLLTGSMYDRDRRIQIVFTITKLHRNIYSNVNTLTYKISFSISCISEQYLLACPIQYSGLYFTALSSCLNPQPFHERIAFRCHLLVLPWMDIFIWHANVHGVLQFLFQIDRQVQILKKFVTQRLKLVIWFLLDIDIRELLFCLAFT